MLPSGALSQMARSFTDEPSCQSELQETVGNWSLVVVGVAFVILWDWKDVHLKTFGIYDVLQIERKTISQLINE